MIALSAPGASLLLLARSMQRAARQGVSWRECVRQVYEFGNRSALLVASGLAFFGVVMVSIAQSQARLFTGNLSLIGPAYFELLVREFGPMCSVLLAAGRAGAVTSAELSSMAVNEQLEALEMSAADPLVDLVAPRVVASLVAIPVLCIVGTVAASASAVLTARWLFEADGSAFIDARYVDFGDILCGVIKSVLCGLYIPAAAAHRGLAAFGGAPAVGRAVSRGVLEAALGCLIIDLVVAVAFLLVGA